jgi:protein-disulfide isomerase
MSSPNTHAMTRSIVLAFLLLATAACGSPERPRDTQPAPAGAMQEGPPDEAFLAAIDSSRIAGAPEASLWVIEVSDFQCPACRSWHEHTYTQFRREFVETGRVRFAYLHFPLPHHANAERAAEASLCAGAQGRFWEMHSRIFETQDQWAPLGNPDGHFDSAASGLGLEMAVFRNCMSNRLTLPVVRGDFERSREVGVNATPTFIIGNTMIPGAAPIEVLRETIESALARTR